eukprot:scaffold160_cov157-Skeletonema_menzelii.AAC.8
MERDEWRRRTVERRKGEEREEKCDSTLEYTRTIVLEILPQPMPFPLLLNPQYHLRYEVSAQVSGILPSKAFITVKIKAECNNIMMCHSDKYVPPPYIPYRSAKRGEPTINKRRALYSC